jgi:NADH:ubiquinone oxidoreductase subunit 5 (subunit L)/multisubunit Na+/H+ antiporter MnhA subunit
MARTSDLPDLVDAALGAVLLLAVAQSICASLVASTTGTIAEAAGTGRIDRLGGLVHAMPAAAGTLAAGLFGLTALPLGIGFGGIWLLFHAVLAAPRTEGVVSQAVVTLLIAALALSGALAAASFVRILGVALLGRPRLPRVSAAEDAAAPLRLLWMAMAGLTVLLGLFPGLVLRVFGDPVVHQITGGGLADHGGVLGLSAAADMPGYAPLPLAVILGIAGTVVFLLYRRQAAPERTGAAWNGGFAPAPAWLPFGDPRTQSNGTGFVPPVAVPVLPEPQRLPFSLSRPVGAWAVLAIMALLLALLSWWART